MGLTMVGHRNNGPGWRLIQALFTPATTAAATSRRPPRGILAGSGKAKMKTNVRTPATWAPTCASQPTSASPTGPGWTAASKTAAIHRTVTP